MTLVLEPDIGVPYSDEIPYMDLRARAEAACNTASMLKEHGLDVEPTSEDEEIAAKLVASYIFEPEVALLTEDLMASAVNDDDFDMIQLKVTNNNPYLNKDYDFAFIDIRNKYSSVLLGIYKGNKLYKNPMGKIVISENDYLLIMTNGKNEPLLETDFEVSQGRF